MTVLSRSKKAASMDRDPTPPVLRRRTGALAPLLRRRKGLAGSKVGGYGRRSPLPPWPCSLAPGVPVLIACWSVKGGSGATVVAAALALLLARSTRGGAALADLAGDAPAAFGVPEPEGGGLAGRLAGGCGLAPVDVGRSLR